MALTKEQHAARVTGLGGSEALAYCGKDPRCSPLQLYLRKQGEAGDRPEDDERQAWGHRLEPVVRDWLADEIGERIIVPNVTIQSDIHPFMFGNLDGRTRNAVVEIKTGDKFTSHEFGEVGSDEVPIRYVLQVTHYMIVTGFRRAHIGALLGGNDARHYVVDYDADLAEQMVKRAYAFWDLVQARTPPDPVNLHDADKRWPNSRKVGVIASPQIIVAIDEIKQLRAAERAAADKADAAELTLKTYMGDNDSLTDAAGRALATWRSQSRDSFDMKAFSADHPDLATQYRKTASFRVFRLK